MFTTERESLLTKGGKSFLLPFMLITCCFAELCSCCKFMDNEEELDDVDEAAE